jgi:hypothetical protein
VVVPKCATVGCVVQHSHDGVRDTALLEALAQVCLREQLTAEPDTDDVQSSSLEMESRLDEMEQRWAQDKIGRSDQAMANGTRIFVSHHAPDKPHGLGYVRGFTRRTLGSNLHLIEFDENTEDSTSWTAVVLKGVEWSVTARE